MVNGFCPVYEIISYSKVKKIFTNILPFTFKSVFHIKPIFFHVEGIRVKCHFPLWISQMNQQLLLKRTKKKKILNEVLMRLNVFLQTVLHPV